MQLPDIIKKRKVLEKNERWNEKEISQVRDKKDKTANKAKQVSLDKKVRVVKGCASYFEIYKSKSNYVKHYKTN
jgi:hypothetical protein